MFDTVFTAKDTMHLVMFWIKADSNLHIFIFLLFPTRLGAYITPPFLRTIPEWSQNA